MHSWAGRFAADGQRRALDGVVQMTPGGRMDRTLDVHGPLVATGRMPLGVTLLQCCRSRPRCEPPTPSKSGGRRARESRPKTRTTAASAALVEGLLGRLLRRVARRPGQRAVSAGHVLDACPPRVTLSARLASMSNFGRLESDCRLGWRRDVSRAPRRAFASRNGSLRKIIRRAL